MDAGEAYLGFWIEALEQYRRNVDAFFSLYTGTQHGETSRKTTDSRGLRPSTPHETPSFRACHDALKPQ